MKKLISVLFVLPAFAGFGQSRIATSSNCDVCSDYVFTSISVLKDVKPTDAYYIPLQSLLERYSINVAPCSLTTFGGSQTLTNGALAQIMSSCLRVISELKKYTIIDKTNTEKIKIEAKVKFSGFDIFSHKYAVIGKVKDVKASDCYYPDVKTLIEDYKIDITNKAGLLQASKPANGKNAGIMLKQVFGLTNINLSKFTKPTITKSEFVMLLSDALDEYNEMLGAAIE